MPNCNDPDDERTWACQSPLVPDSEIGCDVGCNPCLADPGSQGLLSNTGVNSQYNKRWLRPSLADESRDATGHRLPLVGGVPMRMPRGSLVYEIAACHDDVTGEETWADSICECPIARFYHPETDTWNVCPATQDDPIIIPEGDYNTCDVYSGYGWPPKFLRCTGKAYGNQPIYVPISGGYVGQGDSVRSSGFHAPDPTPCSSNMGVPCWAHIEDSDCDIGGPWPEPDGFYNETGYTKWDFAYLSDVTAQFVQPVGAPDDFAAMVDAKNAALAFIADHDLPADANEVRNFEQLDSVRRTASPGDGSVNTALDEWTRSWNIFVSSEDMLTIAQLPAVAEFPGSHLQGSRHPIVVEYVIFGVHVEMSLVLHRIKDWDPLAPLDPTTDAHKPTYPMIRIRMDVRMGLRARWIDGEATHYLQRPWVDPADQVELSLLNRYAQRSPVVLPAGSDRIVYVDGQGRTFTPPLRFMWEGHVGFFSDPPSADHFDYTRYGAGDATLANQCKALASGISDLEGVGPMTVPAMESHPDFDAGERRRIWTGEARIAFPWEA